MKVLALLGVLIGTPVAAFDIDHAALFRAHGGEVRQVGENLRMLELDGSVVINERTNDDGKVSYVSIDRSEFGAAGCTFRILLEMVAATRMCEGVLEPEEITKLENSLTQSAQFVAANTFPVVPANEVQPMLHDRLNKFIDKVQGQGGANCPLPGEDVDGFVEMARRMAQPEGQEALQRVISVPRLPAMNPCL